MISVKLVKIMLSKDLPIGLIHILSDFYCLSSDKKSEERTKEKTMKSFALSKERTLAISNFDALYEDTKMGYFH